MHMKSKCRFFITVLLISCLTSGTIVFGQANDMASTYESELSIMTIEIPNQEIEPSLGQEVTPTNQEELDDDMAQETTKDVTQIVPQFKMNAKAAVVVEAETGKILFSLNENEPLPIASITKIMTMLLVMQDIDSGKIKASDTTTISAYATRMGGTQVYLKEGEVFTIDELLKAVAVRSANDASVALAEVIAGSEEVFVAMMNQKAQELKMKNTKFLDCTGLTDEGHYSTAADIAVMSRELLNKHPKIIHYTTIWHDTFRDGSFDLDNTNRLIKRYKGSTGLKTGFTSKAGFCLSASAEKEGTKIISVILGSDTNANRFSETAKLLDFAFSNYESAKIEKIGLDAGSVKVKKGMHTEIPVTFSSNATVVVRKGSRDNLTETIDMPEIINAPIKVGEAVGVLKIDLEGEPLATIEIVAAEDSPKATFGLILGMIMRRWATLFC